MMKMIAMMRSSRKKGNLKKDDKDDADEADN